MPQLQKTDQTLFYTTIFLAFFGLLMVYSASSVTARVRYHSEIHFAVQQAIALGVSLVVMMVLKKTPYKRLQTPGVAFAAIGFVLILLVVVYFFGRHHRWLRVGSVGIQPAELAKPAVVLFLAYFVALRARAINNRYTLWPALMAVGVVTAGVVVADLGTAVVLGITAGAVFFVAGLEKRYLLGMVGLSVLVVASAVVAKPYRLNRAWQYFDRDYTTLDRIDSSGKIKAYLHNSLAARDTNYQAEQSKIAVGSGGVWGLGLMRGIQKLFYLPEAHTDFIYAVVGEELGMLRGSLIVLFAFCVILWRGVRTTMMAKDDFGKYLALGITTMIVVQAFMNISVVLAMGPTKGIPLPLISFGTNSLLSTLAMMGMLMNISENAA